MRFSELVAGIRDLLRPSEIWNDLRHMPSGIRNLVEGIWNEERVVKRNAAQRRTAFRPPTNSVIGIDSVLARLATDYCHKAE